MNISNHRRPLLGTLLALAVALSVTVPVSAATAYVPFEYEYGDPQEMGCSEDARTIAVYPMHRPGYEEELAYLEVRYSEDCGTNWLRLENPFDEDYLVQMEIKAMPVVNPTVYTSDPERSNNMALATGGGDVSIWSGMTLAPGSTCIKFRAYVVGPDHQYAAIIDTEANGFVTLC